VRAGATADSHLVLSGEYAIRREENRRANAVIFPQYRASAATKRIESAQKWLLKEDLKFTHRTELVGKDSLKMFDGLAERIGLGTVGCSVLAAQAAPQRIEPSAQPVHQMIKGLQSKRQAERLGGRFDARLAQQLAE